MSHGRGGATLALVGLVAGLHGCSFERRADVEEADERPNGEGVAEPTSAALAEDSIMNVIDAVNRALASGDAARVASLVGPDALLVDQEEGVRWSPDLEGPLPSALTPGLVAPNGLRWELIGTRIDALGTARLVVLRYRAAIAGEAVPWWAVETLLLEPGLEGSWRLHYMHRSRGPGGA